MLMALASGMGRRSGAASAQFYARPAPRESIRVSLLLPSNASAPPRTRAARALTGRGAKSCRTGLATERCRASAPWGSPSCAASRAARRLTAGASPAEIGSSGRCVPLDSGIHRCLWPSPSSSPGRLRTRSASVPCYPFRALFAASRGVRFVAVAIAQVSRIARSQQQRDRAPIPLESSGAANPAALPPMRSSCHTRRPRHAKRTQ